MEKINVAELLKDCPKGMELDCTMFDDIVFNTVEFGKTIIVTRTNGTDIHLDKYGIFSNGKDAKCIIFPKGKTTWEGFVPPCQFKNGDIIFTHSGKYSWISIFKQFSGKSCCTYIDLCTNDNDNDLVNDTHCLCHIEEINAQRLATEEEKQQLFDAIKDHGYRWNDKTKTLEELPKFKVGDRITNGKTSITIGYIDNEYYYEIGRNIANRLFIKNQDEWNLVSNKFDINTLKPFESRVLVRDSNRKWRPAVYGFCDKFETRCAFYAVGGCVFEQCIPYEGNEHLLGTNNDCNEFFKTWK